MALCWGPQAFAMAKYWGLVISIELGGALVYDYYIGVIRGTVRIDLCGFPALSADTMYPKPRTLNPKRSGGVQD